MMNQQAIANFLEKYAKNQHSEQEHQAFIQWLHTAPIGQVSQIMEQYEGIATMRHEEEPTQYTQLIAKLEHRLNHIEERNQPILQTSRLWNNWKQIASVAAVIVVGFAVYLSVNDQQQLLVTTKAHKVQGRQPVGNHAVLTLADGSTVVLEQEKNGLISIDGGAKIRKTASGQIIYDVANLKESKEVVYNTISTPKGGQYQVVLADGSKVWLNAASSLKFPTAFTGKERQVELTGEAYFEIAKVSVRNATNKNLTSLPFKVASAGQTVEVLGTHFNINAYAEEASANTTLLEGSVRVVQHQTGNSKILKPGQQAKVNQNVQVANVDVAQVMAWKNGYFSFSEESIESVMRKISRWYDVDVQYHGNPTNEAFSGSVSQFKELAEVLHKLELTGTVHFKTVNYQTPSGKQGRRVIVMP